MSRVVYSLDETLFPRLDKSHAQVSSEKIAKLIEDNPEYLKMRVDIYLTEYDNGSARLQINVLNPYAVSKKEYLIYFLIMVLGFWVLVSYL